MLEFTLTLGEWQEYARQMRDLIRYIRDGIYEGLDRHEAPTQTAQRIVNTPLMKQWANIDALQELYSPCPQVRITRRHHNPIEEIGVAKCLQCDREYVKNNETHFFCKARCARKWVLRNWMGKEAIC